MRHFSKRWLWAALAAAAGVLCLILIPKPALPPPSKALLSASEGLDNIVIEAVLEPATRTLKVTQRLTLTSHAAESRETLVLHTWPNAFQSLDTSPCALEESYSSFYPEGFSTGSLTMAQAAVAIGDSDLRPVLYRYGDAAKTVLILPLDTPWRTNEALTAELRYTVTISRTAYRFGVSGGIWALGNAFAIPAVWENGGYRTDDYSPIGDPFLSDPANYTVTLSLPDGYTCAASAYPAVEQTESGTVHHFSALATRDFALTVSDRYQTAQAMENGTLITVLAANGGRAAEALGYARKALKCYSSLYGAYPWPSLTLGEIASPQAGMEYPAMIMLSGDTLKAGGRTLEYAVAHEMAHQWWYAVVGSDQVNQAWQDEALCEFSLLSYVEAQYGAAERAEVYETRVAPSMRVTMPRGVTPGAPLSYFSTTAQYVTLVYERGAAMLCALDTMMDGDLNDCLRLYYERFRFKRPSREAFTALLTECTGEDFAPLIADYLDTCITP